MDLAYTPEQEAFRKEARAWLEELSKLALEDGNVSRRELRFLQRAAKTLHIPPRDFRKYFAAVHRDLYRNAKSAKRRWAPQPSPYAEEGVPIQRAFRHSSRD